MFSTDTISKVNRLPKKKINKKYIPIFLILSFIPSSLTLTRATISLYCPRRSETGVKRKAGLGTVVNPVILALGRWYLEKQKFKPSFG